MTNRITTVTDELKEARDYLNDVLDEVGNRWDTQVYSDGWAWTVRQLVNHLADADRGHNYQVMNIAEGNDVIPEDFDIERYNRRFTEKTAEKKAQESRQELAETRAALNTWLSELDEDKLDTKGRHASLQILTIEQILRLMAGHERHHAEDIASALEIDV